MKPMLATLVKEPFDSKEWIFETKFDGFRALAHKNRTVQLLSRNNHPFNVVYKQMRKHLSSTSPFSNAPKPNAKVVWFKPKLICEIAFAEWTRAGILRQPGFQELRADKPAGKVVRERS